MTSRSTLVRTVAACGGSLAVATSLMLPLSAHAATNYVCSLTAKTTSLTPIPAPPKRGGTGSYTLSGTATCVVGSKTQHYNVSSSGSYVNQVCGTGSAHGTANFSSGLRSIGYSVTFVAGAGTFKVTSGGTGNGAVDIAPANTGGCVSKPVTGFTIRAAVKVTQ
jgi:hypothetical protein